jgi:hypothetical protein
MIAAAAKDCWVVCGSFVTGLEESLVFLGPELLPLCHGFESGMCLSKYLHHMVNQADEIPKQDLCASSCNPPWIL